ncbi:hypothetical protein [Symbioplanes lichenis]|uniref:hypothetical protein n=1 Tax=Symbioplanes lichenis TaxID=1629072 RepID=UPI002739F52E|nr:hypothetical protein [Actinoplanes lichenis]
MDVRGVLRRARLPLVASLFLALLGGPAVAPPAPAPVPVVAQAASSSVAAFDETPDVPAVSTPVAVPAPAFAAVPQLSGLVGGPAAAPRAPPVRA